MWNNRSDLPLDQVQRCNSSQFWFGFALRILVSWEEIESSSLSLNSVNMQHYMNLSRRETECVPMAEASHKKEPRKESKCDRAAEQLSWLSRPIWTSPDSHDPLPTCWPDASRTRDVNLNAEHKTQGSDAKRQKDDKAKHIGQSDKNDKFLYVCWMTRGGFTRFTCFTRRRVRF
jgi:hypothetical protein